MFHWIVYAWLAAPVAPAPPTLPPSSTATAPTTTAPAPAPAQPQARTESRPPQTLAPPSPRPTRKRTHTWKPPADLVEVPFPLEQRPAPKPGEHRRRRAPVVDLRDPFVTGGDTRPVPAHLRARLLPDLKDPFLAPRHPRPEGWKVALPGDIRDPFSERNRRPLYDCHGVPKTTADGVSIQRPGQAKDKGEAPDARQECRRSARTMPADLQDPFRKR